MAKWSDFTKSARMTAGGLDERPPLKWYDRRVYEAGTEHKNPVKAVNDEMHRDAQREEAEKKRRWEETKNRWSGAFRQFANTLSQTDASPGGGYENVAAKNDAIVAEPAVRAIGSAIGAGSGLLMGLYDKFKRNPLRYLYGMRNGGFDNLLDEFGHRNDGLPGTWDFVSAGAKAGWRHGPQMAAGMAEGAKDAVPGILDAFGGQRLGDKARGFQNLIGFNQMMDGISGWNKSIEKREDAEDDNLANALINARPEDLADPDSEPYRILAERQDMRNSVREASRPAGEYALLSAGATPMSLLSKGVSPALSAAKNPWISAAGKAFARSAPWNDTYMMFAPDYAHGANGIIDKMNAANRRKEKFRRMRRSGEIPDDSPFARKVDEYIGRW